MWRAGYDKRDPRYGYPIETNISRPNAWYAALAALVEGLAEPRSDQLVRFQCEGAVGGEDPQVRFTPDKPAQLLATLIARFDPAQLLATNCFVRDEENKLKFIPGLCVPSAPVLLVRAANNEAPLAVVADGRLPNMRPSLLDIFLDTETRRRIEVRDARNRDRERRDGSLLAAIGPRRRTDRLI